MSDMNLKNEELEQNTEQLADDLAEEVTGGSAERCMGRMTVFRTGQGSRCTKNRPILQYDEPENPACQKKVKVIC